MLQPTASINDVLAHWRRTIDVARNELDRLPDQHARARLRPGKWSIKEIIGHLIDSASNNHWRFVEAQLRDDLVFPGYDQDAWVGRQQYQEAPWPELVTLWAAFNHQLIHVVTMTPATTLERERAVHNLDELAWRPVPRSEPVTLAYFIRDYVEHLEHHLVQVRAIANGLPSSRHQ